MDGITVYMIELYHFSIDRGDYESASRLLKSLSRRLPADDIEGLREEIPDYQTQLRNRTADRSIEHLVHFTQLCNVASILEYGLIPRQHLAKTLGCRKADVKFNDQWRFDDHLDASCLSISFPNYRMFFRYQNSLQGADWAVLLIDPAVLWRLDCAFYVTNAASKRMCNSPEDDFRKISAFDALFEDYEDGDRCAKRADLHLPKFFPTNPQAEVLVFDIIPAEFIFAVCLPGLRENLPDYRQVSKHIDVRIEPSCFGPRVDYRAWSNEK